jgi:hypothetical protein
MKARARFVMIAPIPGVLTMLAAGLPGVMAPGAWTPIRIAGVVVTVAGLSALTLARWQLGDAFSIEARATMLVTHGLYAQSATRCTSSGSFSSPGSSCTSTCSGFSPC